MQARIAAAVDASGDRIAALLADLIGLDSVVKMNPLEAGPGERLCQDYLKARIEILGFTTDLWEPDRPALLAKYAGRAGAHKGRTFDNHPNLGGTLKGTGGGRSLMLNGHIDVVPTGPMLHWKTPPFKAIMQDGVDKQGI